MRAFLRQLDTETAVVAGVGVLIGLVWLASLPLGLALTGVVAPMGAILLVLRRRWIEIGILLAAMGLVPLLAYRAFGPPVVTAPLRDDVMPIELLAPGGAYFLLVAGVVVALVAGVLELQHGRGRERRGAAHSVRRRHRLGNRPS